MAIIEYEIESRAFAGLVSNQVKRAPLIPTPTLEVLGADRLICDLNWGSWFRVEPGLEGYPLAPGAIMLKAPLKLWHVSVAELRANPDTFGTAVDATAWMTVSIGGKGAEVSLVAASISNGAPGILSQPVRLCRLPLPGSAFSSMSKMAFFNLGRTVVFRISTAPSDNLSILQTSRLSPFLNSSGGQESRNWLLHIPAQVFVDLTLERMTEQLSPPPPGLVVEESPRASWQRLPNGQWGVSGFAGVQKPDACPGLFGDVDLSADVRLRLTFAIPPEGDSLDFTMVVDADASDWDSARCWLGSGGAVSWVLGFMTPLLGIGGAIGSLIYVGETVRSEVGAQSGSFGGTGLTLVSQSSSSATYAGSYPLQPVPGTLGTVVSEIGADGLTCRGTTIAELLVSVSDEPAPIPDPRHRITFIPNGGDLLATWIPKINCSSRGMDWTIQVPEILVSDEVEFEGTTHVPVRVFSTSSAEPAGEYYVDTYDSNSFPRPVRISRGTSSSGRNGFVVVHTSAGLRAYTVIVSDTRPQLVPDMRQLIDSYCDTFQELNRRIEIHEIKWVEPPPNYHFGADAVRQWQILVDGLDEGTELTISVLRDGRLEPTSWHRGMVREGSRAWGEFLTDSHSELAVQVTSQAAPVQLHTMKRWLLPISASEPVGEVRGLSRSGGSIQYQTDHTNDRVAVDRLVPFFAGRDHDEREPDGKSSMDLANTFSIVPSISLPDNRVAFLSGDRVVMALAYSGADVVIH